MSKIPIALQLYSVRDACAEDLPGTLKKVADMGYDGVEFAGYYDYAATDLRTLLDDNGLKCAGSHLGIGTLQGDELEKTVEFSKTLGTRFAIVPGLPAEMTESLDAWRKTADEFRSIAERLKALDMQTGYHNHSVEFTLIDGQYAWDVFFANTPDDVIMQVDTGNAMHAGVDVTPYVERYPGRAITVHLKEWTDDPDGAALGNGKFPWPGFFTLCESIGNTEWYIVEQETYPQPPMEIIETCIKNLRDMGK